MNAPASSSTADAVANQPAADKQAATFRFHRPVLDAARAEAGARGETLTAVIDRALREYAADRLTAAPERRE